jgi:hypothetical protein
METETIDRLFLELSQFTRATTAKEVRLQARVAELEKAIQPFAELVRTTNGRIPHERLSAADWHELAKVASGVQENGNGR